MGRERETETVEVEREIKRQKEETVPDIQDMKHAARGGESSSPDPVLNIVIKCRGKAYNQNIFKNISSNNRDRNYW